MTSRVADLHGDAVVCQRDWLRKIISVILRMKLVDGDDLARRKCIGEAA